MGMRCFGSSSTYDKGSNTSVNVRLPNPDPENYNIRRRMVIRLQGHNELHAGNRCLRYPVHQDVQ